MILNKTYIQRPKILNGLLRAILMDKIPVFADGVNGADHAALWDSHLQLLASAGIFVPIIPLQTGVVMDSPASSGTQLRIAAHIEALVATTL